LLLDSEEERRRMSRVHNPYGDGQASRRIADAIAKFQHEAAR
jgi:UDP-N-acetylglucosamine 2-epimerase (non-hydrolysing)